MTTKQFFAFLLPVAVMGFMATACSDNSNDPDNSTTPPTGGSTINPADYFGMWRIDTVKVNGVLQGPPHKVIDIISASQLVFDGNDTRSYSIVGDIITIEDATGISFKVIDSSPAVPHLLAVFADQTPSQDLYLARIPDVQGTQVILSEAAILGTWKLEYNMIEDYNGGSLTPTFISKQTDKGVTTWKFEANGVATCSNTVNIAGGGSPESGWWVIKNGKFEYGTGTQPVDSDLNPYDAYVTDKSIKLSKTTVWPTVTCKDYYFFSKVQ